MTWHVACLLLFVLDQNVVEVLIKELQIVLHLHIEWNLSKSTTDRK